MLVSNQGSAYACSCIPLPPPKEALKESTAVFVGTVASISNVRDPVIVKFNVVKNVRGAGKQILTLTTARDSASCGYQFFVNKTYLVYVYGEPGSLTTNICTRTAELRNAKEDIKALNIKLEKRAPENKPAISQTSDDEISRYAFIILILTAIAYYLFKKTGR